VSLELRVPLMGCTRGSSGGSSWLLFVMSTCGWKELTGFGLRDGVYGAENWCSCGRPCIEAGGA
jgi:hypothetical protein